MNVRKQNFDDEMNEEELKNEELFQNLVHHQKHEILQRYSTNFRMISCYHMHDIVIITDERYGELEKKYECGHLHLQIVLDDDEI